VLGHAHATVLNVEDLAALVARGPCPPKRHATATAASRRVGDDFVRSRDLPESPALVTQLAADFQPGLLSQAFGAPDLLPGRIKGRR
jgi:hypothetical protein